MHRVCAGFFEDTGAGLGGGAGGDNIIHQQHGLVAHHWGGHKSFFQVKHIALSSALSMSHLLLGGLGARKPVEAQFFVCVLGQGFAEQNRLVKPALQIA